MSRQIWGICVSTMSWIWREGDIPALPSVVRRKLSTNWCHSLGSTKLFFSDFVVLPTTFYLLFFLFLFSLTPLPKKKKKCSLNHHSSKSLIIIFALQVPAWPQVALIIPRSGVRSPASSSCFACQPTN